MGLTVRRQNCRHGMTAGLPAAVFNAAVIGGFIQHPAAGLGDAYRIDLILFRIGIAQNGCGGNTGNVVFGGNTAEYDDYVQFIHKIKNLKTSGVADGIKSPHIDITLYYTSNLPYMRAKNATNFKNYPYMFSTFRPFSLQPGLV